MLTIKKDITTVEKGVLLNGVNCQHRMGSGVAKAYYTKWPQVRNEYMLVPAKLGHLYVVTINKHELYVANCYTQEYYGYDGAKYASEDAVILSVTKAALFAKKVGLEIYTPLIGAGLGGLNKQDVIDILEGIEKTTKVPFTLCLVP
jgi:O-acetyl-ADP-ribose deacetylase (regulator of RNase III)